MIEQAVALETSRILSTCFDLKNGFLSNSSVVISESFFRRIIFSSVMFSPFIFDIMDLPNRAKEGAGHFEPGFEFALFFSRLSCRVHQLKGSRLFAAESKPHK